MSKQYNFRFDDYLEDLFHECQLPGTTYSNTLKTALEYYYNNVVMPYKEFDFVIDFSDNIKLNNENNVYEFLTFLYDNGYKIQKFADTFKYGIKKAD